MHDKFITVRDICLIYYKSENLMFSLICRAIQMFAFFNRMFAVSDKMFSVTAPILCH